MWGRRQKKETEEDNGVQRAKVIIVMGKVSELKSNYCKLISSSIKKLLANKSTIHQKTAHHDQADFASGMLGRYIYSNS